MQATTAEQWLQLADAQGPRPSIQTTHMLADGQPRSVAINRPGSEWIVALLRSLNVEAAFDVNLPRQCAIHSTLSRTKFPLGHRDQTFRFSLLATSGRPEKILHVSSGRQ